MNLLKYILPKSWTASKTSENSNLTNISNGEIDKWQIDHWRKDKVNKLIQKDGFYLKPDGRNGTIYFVEKNKLCQIYYETSAVKEFDILIFFEQLKEWELPNKKVMLENEIEIIKEKLLVWLKSKKIKSDL
jgi:hypothetical protein